jgi:P-aminobenzoate N-oxygenase AurF
MEPLALIVEQLHASSVRNFVNPYTFLDWPAKIDPSSWYTSPELVSLYGTDVWDTLDEAARKRLAFHEAVNFFSLNIYGERQQMEGLSRRLYSGETPVISKYLHHFLDEENKHNVVFAEFCLRYAQKLYPHGALSLERQYAPGEEDFLFFARILMFEEIAVSHNAAMARDERLADIARAINRFHHVEEIRHLRFGRAIVRDLWGRFAPQWSVEVSDRVRDEVVAFLRATWLQYYNAAAYRDAGIPDPFRLRVTAFEHPQSRIRRAALTERCVKFFKSNGILEEEVQP